MLESSLLGVIDWWLGNHTREEVLVLINRHFRPEEVFDAHKLLAQACKLNDPIKHKNSALRKAGEVQAVDLVNDMDRLDLGKTGPRYLIPSDQLGRVPLGALSVRDEVSVGARLESLEVNMRKVCSVLEGIQANPPAAVTYRLSKLDDSIKTVTSLLGQVSEPPKTFASIAGGTGPGIVPSLVVNPPQVAAGRLPDLNGQPHKEGAGALGTGLGTETRSRNRSVSPSVKRKAGGDQGEDREGFRFQGRPRQRKTAGGTSQVVIGDVGEYVAPAEFYIGNTDSRANEDTIKTVLKRCAAAVEGGSDLVVDKVELLTKELDPRTKCWKVVVPYRFKSLMERDEVYPAGWKHRTFFGSRNVRDKRTKLDQGSIEHQVLQEQQKESEKLRQEQQLSEAEKKIQQLEKRLTEPPVTGSNSTS